MPFTNTPFGNQFIVSSQTLSGSDATFTFDPRMERFWVSSDGAKTLMSLAGQTSGKGQMTLPSGSITEFRLPELAGQTITFNSATAVVGIMQKLTGAIPITQPQFTG